MKKTLLTAICCFAAIALHAQTPSFDWAINMGGINYDRSYDIAVDATGNVYTTGKIAGTADFDPGAGVLNLVSNGGDDMFIAKYSATGTLLWAHNIGGTGTETAQSMALDATGNCYITGRFAGTVDFDPGAGISTINSSGPFDVYIVKLNSSGNFVWAKNFGGTFGTFVNAISLDASGSVYTVGTFQTTTDFDPSAAVFNLVSDGGQDTYVAKLDASGNFVWAKRTDFAINAINIDINNTIYLAGTFNDTTDFNPDTTQTFNLIPAGGADIHICKFDTAANFVWVKSIGGTDSESPSAINTDATGNIIVTGTFRGTVDFDPGAGTSNLTAVGTGSNLSDMYFLKLDAAANFMWVKRIGGNSIDLPSDIDTDNAGNVYFSGRFNSATVDFNPDTAVTFNLNGTFSSYDSFVLILSAAGNFIYAYEIGGPSNGDDEANGICVNPSGSFYVTGTFYGPIDFDPGAGTASVNDNGNTDAYIQKMNFSPTGILQYDAENSFTVYPNPASKECIVYCSKFNDGYDLKIFDMLGKEILKTETRGEKTIIDVSKFENGIYFIQLTSPSLLERVGMMSQKLIIAR
ncbi:MAG TPA: T9SS type A sorting domain-containing protein [Bacteroidia bacterium]|nr:T9SS type A sorting domain-containing protein [Bacteroidia bacterium]HNU32349.1 T9SS type A sorting domain-containing protein [Bacteroidia bacterium]